MGGNVCTSRANGKMSALEDRNLSPVVSTVAAPLAGTLALAVGGTFSSSSSDSTKAPGRSSSSSNSDSMETPSYSSSSGSLKAPGSIGIMFLVVNSSSVGMEAEVTHNSTHISRNSSASFSRG